MAIVYWPLSCLAMYLSLCFVLKQNNFNLGCPSYDHKNVFLKNNLRPVSRKPAQKDHGKWHSPVDDDKQDETLNTLNTTQCGPDQTYITVLRPSSQPPKILLA